MTNKTLLTTLVAITATVATTFAAPTQRWNQGDPTADEQYALEVVNRMRHDPVAALNFYISQNSPTVQGALNRIGQYGGDPATVALTTLAGLMNTWNSNYKFQPTGLPPFALYPLYTKVARDNIPTYEANNNLTVDTSKLPTTVPFVPVGYVMNWTQGQAPEITGPNTSGGTATIRGYIKLSVDPRVDGFRRDQMLWAANLYDSRISLREESIVDVPNYFQTNYSNWTPGVPVGGDYSGFDFRYGHAGLVGVAIGSVRTGSNGAGGRSLMLFSTDQEAFSVSDLPYGADNTRFITGVVYTDADKDGDYTPGEGMAGVTITPSTGDWYTVTSASGGYAIPVAKNSGSITLTLTKNGVDFAKTTVFVNYQSVANGASATTSVATDNVKVDFVIGQDKAPQVNIAGGSANAPMLVNLSTRGVSEPDANALIGGFVISGPDTVKKKVLIRAVGYTMGGFGIRTYLPKPLLKLFPGGVNTPIAIAMTEQSYVANPSYNPNNTSWSGNSPWIVDPTLAKQMESVGAFGFALPIKTATSVQDYDNGIKYGGDAALVVDLAPGLYTAVVTPDPKTPVDAVSYVTNGTGIRGTAASGVVLLEIYDMTKGDGAVLVNLSSRGTIANTLPAAYSLQDKSLLDERKMIVGYVLAGGDDNASTRLVIRAVSPGMVPLGVDVASVIDDPILTVYRADSSVEETVDDWGTSSHADQLTTLMPAVGAFGLSPTSKDAATVGLYKAGLHSVGTKAGTGKATGIVLDEVYLAN